MGEANRKRLGYDIGTLVYIAVLFAAVLHAGWNAVLRIRLDRNATMVLLAIVQALTQWFFIGWNFGFIGATTMLDAALSAGERAAVQGANDTIIALVSTICAFAAGLVISSLGWGVLAMISGGVVLLFIAVLLVDSVSTGQAKA